MNITAESIQAAWRSGLCPIVDGITGSNGDKMSSLAWEHLLAMRTDEGIRMMLQTFEQYPSPSHATELGVGYLWSKQYQRASQHFRQLNAAYPSRIESYYAMEGTARWCCKEYDAAVQTWIDGIDCVYTDAAGGVSLPLLLCSAAALRPGMNVEYDAVAALRQRLAKKRTNNWPEPLALLLLGDYDSSAVVSAIPYETDRAKEACRWQLAFYQAIVYAMTGNIVQRDDSFRNLLSQTDRSTIDLDTFLSRVWAPEFYFARHCIGD